MRRRGKKAELLFSLGAKDLTTLAVKDTQAAIDEALGTGGGLLQRCCFFGQHSHTLQSLLGLTDVRLKVDPMPCMPHIYAYMSFTCNVQNMLLFMLCFVLYMCEAYRT